MRRIYEHIDQGYFRVIMFGCEDALVSTTGVVVGISVGIENPGIIVLASLVTVAVEGLSMAVGHYVSEKAVFELRGIKEDIKNNSLVIGSLLMFFSYFFSGLIPIIPVFFLSLPLARILCVVFSGIGLFVQGYFKGRLVGIRPVRSALEILTIGGATALIGIFMGLFLKIK